MRRSCAGIRLAPDLIARSVGAGSPANRVLEGAVRVQGRSHGALAGRPARVTVNEKSRLSAGFSLRLVPRRGLEPPRLAALVPETSASTNSAIWAGTRIIANSFAMGKGEARFFALQRAGVVLIARRLLVPARRATAQGDGIAGQKQESRSEERLSRETGAQKRTRTSTPRSAST